MGDRLTDIVLGLQRLAEGAQQRGDDLRYIQSQETAEHIGYLDHMLAMVDKVRSALLDERKRFMPVDNVQRLDERQTKAVGRTPAG